MFEVSTAQHWGEEKAKLLAQKLVAQLVLVRSNDGQASLLVIGGFGVDNSVALVQLVIRLTLGLIFAVSAVAKLRNLSSFAIGVAEYKMLPTLVAKLLGYVLPFIEIVLSILLLTGFAPIVAASLALFLIVVFAVALGINAARGRAILCHCFGTNSSSRIGWHSLVRDIILLPAVCWLLWMSFTSSIELATNTAFVVPTLLLAVIATLAYMLVVEGLDLVIAHRVPTL